MDADMEKLREAREKARVKARARAKASTEKKKVVVEKKKRKLKEEEKVSDSDNNDQELEGEEDEEEEEGEEKEDDEGGNGDAEGNEVEMAEVGEVCQTGGMDSEEMEIEEGGMDSETRPDSFKSSFLQECGDLGDSYIDIHGRRLGKRHGRRYFQFSTIIN